jgi:hypothetical protein
MFRIRIIFVQALPRRTSIYPYMHRYTQADRRRHRRHFRNHLFIFKETYSVKIVKITRSVFLMITIIAYAYYAYENVKL